VGGGGGGFPYARFPIWVNVKAPFLSFFFFPLKLRTFMVGEFFFKKILFDYLAPVGGSVVPISPQVIFFWLFIIRKIEGLWLDGG